MYNPIITYSVPSDFSVSSVYFFLNRLHRRHLEDAAFFIVGRPLPYLPAPLKVSGAHLHPVFAEPFLKAGGFIVYGAALGSDTAVAVIFDVLFPGEFFYRH